MQTITIDKKDYKVVNDVALEINWLRSQLKSAKRLIEQIEDLEDELETIVYNHAGEKQKLINQIKNL